MFTRPDKERRKEYRGAKAASRSCRNHGSCDWCNRSRTIQHQRALIAARDHERHWYSEEYDEVLDMTPELWRHAERRAAREKVARALDPSYQSPWVVISNPYVSRFEPYIDDHDADDYLSEHAPRSYDVL